MALDGVMYYSHFALYYDAEYIKAISLTTSPEMDEIMMSAQLVSLLSFIYADICPDAKPEDSDWPEKPDVWTNKSPVFLLVDELSP